MWLCLACRWKMVFLITNHVIMWKPQHPQRINESLLDKINDSHCAGLWWWLSTRAMGGQICTWVCTCLDELSEFVEASNWTRRTHRKRMITLFLWFFPLICVKTGGLIRNDIRQLYEIARLHSSISALCSRNQMQQNLGHVTHSSCQGEWYSHQAFFGGGQLLHLFCGCKLWFGEMHHFGSTECFSNVLIKASPRCTPSPLSPPHFQG